LVFVALMMVMMVMFVVMVMVVIMVGHTLIVSFLIPHSPDYS
jgi:hypothetical protein